MIRKAMAFLVAAAGLVGLTGPAGASTYFHNNSPYYISAAHAFDSTSGFLCGYSDGCPSNWRLTGWYNLAPGQTMKVESHGYGNASHDIYAFDGAGHEWYGGGDSGNPLGGDYGIPFDRGFSGCQYDFLGTPNTEYRQFARVRYAQCCGGSCPGDGTINFN